MNARAQQGGLITDRAWQERVLDETWRRLPQPVVETNHATLDS